MENELEVVNIRLVREPSLYSEQILDSPQAVVELLDHIIVGGTNGKMLSFREEKMLNVTGRMDWERQKKKELEVFIYCNISCSGISKIVSLQKADLYIDIICITQNKIVKNRKRNNI